MKQLKIYFASKTKHGETWKSISRALSEKIQVTSTWINECHAGQTTCWENLWERCVNEPKQSDVLILYSEKGDHLKGALVEVGSALASGVPVFVVGEIPDHSWTRHRLVHQFDTVEKAIEAGIKLVQ